MKKFWRNLVSVLLSAVLICSMLTVPSFAEPEKQPGTDLLQESVLSNLLTTDLYVAKDKKAGLRSEVNVLMDLARFGGTVYLPGCANVKKLRLA